jgi:hypothetical protein
MPDDLEPSPQAPQPFLAGWRPYGTEGLSFGPSAGVLLDR